MKIINGLKYWGQIFLLPIYWLSFLVPRNKNIWLFGSTFGRRFADNPRYFYLEMNKNQNGDLANQVKVELNIINSQQKIRPIWISHRKDIVEFLMKEEYEAYHYQSIKGMWYALRGGAYFYDNYSKDINFWLSGGALKVNLWHGIPLKMIQHDNLHDKFRHPKNIWEKFKNFPRNISDEKSSDYIVSPSRMFDDIFSRAFKTKHVLKADYPRWNILNPQNSLDDSINSRFCLPLEQKYLNYIDSFRKKKPDGKVLCYMPTFRDSEVKLIEEIKKVGIITIQNYLKKNNFMLVVKLHPKSKIEEDLKQILRKCSKRIVLVKDDCDSNLFLKEADLLITDYSSCYFDFLITEKPIVYFNYDYQEYIKESRDLYFNYDEMIAGDKVDNIYSLGKKVKYLLENEKKSNGKIARLKNLILQNK